MSLTTTKRFYPIILLALANFAGCDTVPAPPTDPSVPPTATATAAPKRKGVVKSIKSFRSADSGSKPPTSPVPEVKPTPEAKHESEPKSEPASSK